MHIFVTVYGMLTAAVADPAHPLELEVPDGTDIRGVIDLLAERSPLFDVRASLAVIDGVKVPLERPLTDREHVHLHRIFGGG